MSRVQGAFYEPLHRTPGVRRYSGSFTTAGSSAPSVIYGEGFTVSAPSTGVYTVTIDQRFTACIAKGADIDGAAGNDDEVRITAHTLGTATANATLTIETQSADGTAANLTGPIVSFWVDFQYSDTAN